MHSSAVIVLLLTVAQVSLSAIVPVEKRLIIGGEKTQINQVPYQVAIIMQDFVVCGGSLIAPAWVLTASHCLDEIQDMKSVIKIRAGSSRRDQGGILRNVKWWTMHPHFDMTYMKNDVALIMLDQPFVLNDNIKCIHMAAPGNMPVVGQDGVASGWGLMRAEDNKTVNANYPKDLYAVHLPVIGWATCKTWYAGYRMFDHLQLCAGYTEGRKDACTGDSGGPYVIGHTQVGVVSWGNSCAKERQPGVYANLGQYRPWVDSNMRKVANPRSLTCRIYY